MILALLACLAAEIDPSQALERTCFQTADPYSDRVNLRADVAIVYGFGKNLTRRVKGWRDHGYRVHFMTGVAWGEYQDYLYGRWDGVNHEQEVQTQSDGQKIGHGGDVYYMSPGESYGKYLCIGVQKAIDAGVQAIHLEEPEFWIRGGYGAGFKREWQAYYDEPWQAPDSSVNARWRASKLMYFLYRRALQQVFGYIADYNRRHGAHVSCYVPTHSLLNYAQWRIVSPESSLARLAGCDGYIAQVWTGTARTPNVYRGVRKERTFETAFLEYGAMQNLVRATGRRVWYLADPVEDDRNHDWGDYKRNYESTLVASLLQPEVWRYEVMPWPNRVLEGLYPSVGAPTKRVPIPAAYATELQAVIHALNDMAQPKTSWDAGTQGIGVLVSDSLMFEGGAPFSSDPDLSQVYGLAMPFVKRGMPVTPVQLENVGLPGYLRPFRVLFLTYEGMKPLTPQVHDALADWVRAGGRLFFVDDDSDPYRLVREWWNTGHLRYATPRLDLWAKLGAANKDGFQTVGAGGIYWLRRRPSELAHDPNGDLILAGLLRDYGGLPYRESGSIVLRRGPYVIAAGLDESPGTPVTLRGRFLDLFGAGIPLVLNPTIAPMQRRLMVNVDADRHRQLLACAGQASDVHETKASWSAKVGGIADCDCVLVLRAPVKPFMVTVNGVSITTFDFDPVSGLLWVRFPGGAKARVVVVDYREPPRPTGRAGQRTMSG